MQQTTVPSFRDGLIPSGCRATKFYRPSTGESFILQSNFGMDPTPISTIDRAGQQNEYAGGTGHSGKTTGSAEVLPIINPATGKQVIVKPNDVFSEEVNAGDGYFNFVVLTAPYTEEAASDRKQNITYQGVANPDAFFSDVAGVLTAVVFPIV